MSRICYGLLYAIGGTNLWGGVQVYVGDWYNEDGLRDGCMKGDRILRYGGDGVGCVGIDMRGFNACHELTGLC